MNDAAGGSDMHRDRAHVVRRLPEIDVVVGMGAARGTSIGPGVSHPVRVVRAANFELDARCSVPSSTAGRAARAGMTATRYNSA